MPYYNTRAAALAYVAARLISGSGFSEIYDHSRSKHLNFSGTVTPNYVSLYDYEAKTHISGSGGGGILNLFYYKEGAHISLRIDGNQFSGFDYASGSHFRGEVHASDIEFYDHRLNQWFKFSRV